jgi:hypothetical protein
MGQSYDSLNTGRVRQYYIYISAVCASLIMKEGENKIEKNEKANS